MTNRVTWRQRDHSNRRVKSAHSLTDTRTHRHTDTQTHRHTDTQTHRHTDTRTQPFIVKDCLRRQRQDSIVSKIATNLINTFTRQADRQTDADMKTRRETYQNAHRHTY